MQKNLPIIIGIVVLVIVVIVVAAAIGGKKQGTPVQPGTSVGRTSAPVRPAPTKEQIKQQNALQTALAEAQKLFDAKDYQGALDKTNAILANMDGTSQAAKNLKQMAQIRLIEQRRTP